MDEHNKTLRKLKKRKKMFHKKEIVLSLSIIFMLFAFLAFLVFSKFFILEKNASGLGYLANYNSNEATYSNGKFTLNLKPEKVSEIKVKVESPVERFPIKLYGTGEDVSIQVGDGTPLIAYGTFEGSTIKMRLFDNRKEIVFNDTISLVFPSSSIYSASIMLGESYELGKELNWDMISLNGYAVVPGLNNLKNKISLDCKTNGCYSNLMLESDVPGSIFVSNLEISYLIERQDYSYEVDSYCKSYPCDVPVKISSLSEGTMTLDIPQVIKLGEETPIIEEPSTVSSQQTFKIAGSSDFLFKVFMMVIMVGLLATLFVSRLVIRPRE